MNNLLDHSFKKSKLLFEQKYCYKTLTKIEEVKKGKPKHISPASKEWNNSNYKFDNNYAVSTAYNDKIASNTVRSYLTSVIYESSRKSKRMKDLIKRSTTKQLFVSNVEVKQTNNKVIITVYMFDRYKQVLTKRIYLLLKYLNFHNIINKPIVFNSFWNKKHQDFLMTYYYTTHIPNILRFDIININILGRFEFLIWVFSILGILYKIKRKKIKSNNKITTKKHIVLVKNNKTIYDTNYYFKKKLTWYDLPIINNKLSRFFYAVTEEYTKKNLARNLLESIVETSIKTKTFMQIMYKHYAINNFKSFLKKNFSIHYYGVVFFDYLNFMRFKLIRGIPQLQHILGKIYNKNVILNIVYLKYLHLNINILTQAITVKLRNKKNKLLRVLKKSLKLAVIRKYYKVKLDTNFLKTYKLYKNKKISLSYLKLLNVNKGLNIHKIYKNLPSLNRIFTTLFVKNNKSIFKQVHKNLGVLKHKRLTGMWLEAKGRLTKRFTASRALHKIRHKGSLQNYEHYLKDLTKTKPSSFMLRGLKRPNIQYSYIASKKRIGAFGVKGWISSN